MEFYNSVFSVVHPFIGDYLVTKLSIDAEVGINITHLAIGLLTIFLLIQLISIFSSFGSGSASGNKTSQSSGVSSKKKLPKKYLLLCGPYQSGKT